MTTQRRKGLFHCRPLSAWNSARRISDQSTGMQARLYSDFPFSWRKDGGPRDDFEREAIRQLRQFPDQPFYRFEDFQGRQSLRYAVADRMGPGCVACHNTHPDSPKTDWKVGDVRGVLEIIRPLDSIIAQTHAGLRETFALMAIIGILGLSGLALVIARLRQNEALQSGEARGGTSRSAEVGFPGQHESRNPHADECHHRSISPRAKDRSKPAPAGLYPQDAKCWTASSRHHQ